MANKEIVLCPLCELGFLRISTQPKFGATMEQARTTLEKLAIDRAAERIADDLPVLDSKPKLSSQVTDLYLCDLAAKHGHKLATLDAGIKHPAAELLN